MYYMRITLLLVITSFILIGCTSPTAVSDANNNSNLTSETTTQIASPCGDGSCDAAELADATLCPVDCAANSTSNSNAADVVEDANLDLAADLLFIPDAGVRLTDASNPGVKFADTDTLALLYENQAAAPGASRHGLANATADSDWLNFTVDAAPVDPDNFRAHTLPDGTCRAYGYNNTKGLGAGETGMTSRSAQDCITFTSDTGTRYDLQPDDNGSLGVYDFFNDNVGGVVMLYIGDLYGVNNVRRAYSTDNGWTFTFTNSNVLSDAELGGGSKSYVDEKTIRLSDGRVRLIAMRQGTIYSFISTDDGKTFSQEAGTRMTPSDFTEFELSSFNDPQIIQLPDGRYRIYATAYFADRERLPVIVSATTQ